MHVRHTNLWLAVVCSAPSRLHPAPLSSFQTGIFITMPATKTQNVVLARGINAISANSLSKKNGRGKVVKKGGDKKVVAKKATTTKKWYPADYIPKPLQSAKTKRNSVKTAKLRKSITPGSVLILLSGRFRGKRVVFLKQLASGLLLVTGPYKVNGVPLRRVNQSYVIATSTKVNIEGLELPAIDDAYFAKEKAAKKTKEEQFFAQSSAAPVISEQRKKDQKAIDSALIKKLDAEPFLKAYLNAKFSLTKNDRAHALKF
ncbi:60S ribosomal protein L6 [Phytophthora ramorum]|nr:60S ribosomal protein L6 [Phytophthora ramorum]